MAQGLVCRGGRGAKTDPYRYWLAAQEQRWLADPDYRFQRLVEAENRQTREGLRGGPLGKE